MDTYLNLKGTLVDIDSLSFCEHYQHLLNCYLYLTIDDTSLDCLNILQINSFCESQMWIIISK